MNSWQRPRVERILEKMLDVESLATPIPLPIGCKTDLVGQREDLLKVRRNSCKDVENVRSFGLRIPRAVSIRVGSRNPLYLSV
jgi:hypothetical protein